MFLLKLRGLAMACRLWGLDFGDHRAWLCEQLERGSLRLDFGAVADRCWHPQRQIPSVLHALSLADSCSDKGMREYERIWEIGGCGAVGGYEKLGTRWCCVLIRVGPPSLKRMLYSFESWVFKSCSPDKIGSYIQARTLIGDNWNLII